MQIPKDTIMEIKTNEATLNRPKGDRIIDAPFVFTNLQTVVNQLKQEEAWANNSRNAITVFKTEGFTIVVLGLRKGEVLNDNETNAMIFLQVLEGVIELQMGEDAIATRAGAGDLLSIHRQLSHPVNAIDDCFLLMTITGEN
jgi:quercetin dioxygenase-like cupin family protein